MDDLEAIKEQITAMGGDPDGLVRFLTEMYHEANRDAQKEPIMLTFSMSWSAYRVLFPRRARIVGMLNKVAYCAVCGKKPPTGWGVLDKGRVWCYDHWMNRGKDE